MQPIRDIGRYHVHMDTEREPNLDFREWLGDQMDRVKMPDQTEFAVFVGVAQSSVSDWLQGPGYPRRSSRIKLSEALGIPLDEIDRIITSSQGRELRIVGRNESSSNIRPVLMDFIPIIGTAAADTWRASWGYGDLYPALRSDTQGVSMPAMMIVSGDCMEPRVNHGDLVILDTDTSPMVGDVVAVRSGDDVTLKEYWSDDGDEIVLRAIKSGYPPIRMKKFDQGAQLVGVVRRWIRSGKV